MCRCAHHGRPARVRVTDGSAPRAQEWSFPPFSAPLSPPLPPIPKRPGTLFGKPLSIISGGGHFYDFNLDFGCCFGTTLPAVPVPPDIASSYEVQLQQPGYRTVLVNGSTAGVGFYPLNAEQDFGSAHTEIRYSRNVTAFGAKSENNFVPSCLLVIRCISDWAGLDMFAYS